MAPRESYALISRTREYCFIWQRDLADVINDFEMGRLFRIIQVGPNCSHKCPNKRFDDSWDRRKCDEWSIMLNFWLWKWRKGAGAKKCKECSSRNWKGKGTNSRLLGKVIKKTWWLLWPTIWTETIGASSLLPVLWNVHFAPLASPTPRNCSSDIALR